MRPEAKKRRTYWVKELAKLSGSFGDDATKVVAELSREIDRDGEDVLLDHLRTCGVMPEQYEHDSSAEKLYSKYTDAVVSEAFSAMGLKSIIISTRADAADVQAHGDYFSLVADAKAFRLSRTAKNQKDFKVQAMEGWRNDNDYAVLVCPIYQLPARNSQIYLQAITSHVCILSYSHLAAFVRLARYSSVQASQKGFARTAQSVSSLHPSKNAVDYWMGVNRTFLKVLQGRGDKIWKEEKLASLESLRIAKEDALRHLQSERDRLLGLSHAEALCELIRLAGFDSRISQVEKITHGDLLGVS